ncbi:MAG: hypothetical protein IT368_16950 [Candidatus Hydrogenedentes bacterium]|nr:hypothetical protein [Candidatus Hydrogenedentota bacterium]
MVLAHDDALLLMGGTEMQGVWSFGDVWRSEDGVSWEALTQRAGWWLSAHTAASFQNQIWIVGGGQSDLGATDEIWSSANGAQWVKEGVICYCAVFSDAALVKHTDQLWACGGFRASFGPGEKSKTIPIQWDEDVLLNDVWTTANGADWQQVTPGADWSARAGHALVSIAGKLWVIGGIGRDGVLGDIWSSVDGIAWEQEVELAPFGVRYNFATAMAPDGTLWISGGQKEQYGSYLSDVWYTTDGVNWTQQSANAWPPRSGHAMVYFKDKLIVLGGEVQLDGVSNFSPSNDIYTLDLSQGQEGEGEGEGEATPPRHTADQDGDNQINLSELLRVIQFYNQPRHDWYWCDSCTEDGYALTGRSHTCAYHSSDYNPPDWDISLGELLRLIQFFNGGGYHACPDTASEDGFCVGAG